MSHPLEKCPYCGNQECHAEWCDVGVGYVQMGPYYCEACGAMEMGPNDEDRPLSEREKKTGWYEPGHLPDTVSSINGTFIEATIAKRLYEMGLVDHVPFRVEWPATKIVALGLNVFDNQPT